MRRDSVLVAVLVALYMLASRGGRANHSALRTG
jgi:hypothetical protein